MNLPVILSYFVMAIGFGFVVFWHELGHFLAAKWAGVKVDQFAVGFGRAALCWRKGIGFTVGTSAKKYEKLALAEWDKRQSTQLQLKEKTLPTLEQLDATAKTIGLGETEYRLNWIPLGGYVKMLGQDDMDPTSQSSDPRSYNMKPVGKRMVIVSAGVVMNVILAAIFFVALFLYGRRVPPAVIGTILPGSPAQAAGLQVGDRILRIGDHDISDFTKISLNVALLPDAEVPLKYERDGAMHDTSVHPRPSAESMNMLAIGIAPPAALRGPDPEKVDMAKFDSLPPDQKLIRPGDVITQIDGKDVKPLPHDQEFANYVQLDRAAQSSNGKPIALTLRGTDGSTRKVEVPVTFVPLFNSQPLTFAGLAPRPVIDDVDDASPVKGKLLPGDIVLSVRNKATDRLEPFMGAAKFVQIVAAAGDLGQKLDVSVLRDGKVVDVKDCETTFATGRNKHGFGVHVAQDVANAVVGGVSENSPSSVAGIPGGSTIKTIDGQDVTSWHDVFRILRTATSGQAMSILMATAEGDKTFSVKLNQSDVDALAGYRYVMNGPALDDTEIVRKTGNPLQAISWGVGETRDLILQSYVTLKRMTVDRTVSPSQLMGPIEIFNSGAAFAQKGPDWFIWFLAMISANLAVVNFLPIPIVDGGLFTFLVIEKLTGKPPSPKIVAVANIAGLVLLLGLFLFVTYNDLGRRFKIW